MTGLVRKGLWSFIMFFTLALPSFAQDRSERYERIERIKVAFITSKLDLTTNEAQKFWPIYNDYQKEMMVLFRKKKEARMKPDMDPNDKINADIAYDSRMLELKKKYKKLYLKAIPAQKILLLYQAEREFREHLIKQLKNRRKDN